MPEARYYPTDQGSDEWKRIEKEFAQELIARSSQIKRNWRYYFGEHKQPLKKQSDGYDDSVVLNNVGPLANRLNYFMSGDGVDFDLGDFQDTLGQDIKDFWKKNRGMITLQQLGLTGIVEGHNAVRVVPMEDWEKLEHIKQENFAVFWDEMDITEVLWYRLQYGLGNGARRVDYVRGSPLGSENKEGIPTIDPDGEGWVEIVYTAEKVPDSLGASKIDWKVDDFQIWPYQVPPIVDWPNIIDPRSYYGRSDLTEAVKLNDNLNFVMSNINRIIKHYAAPRTVGIGFRPGEVIATEVGGLLTINKDKNLVDIFNLEMQSDLGSSMTMAMKIVQGIWQSGGMVDPGVVQDRVGQLTNFGLRVLFSDAIKRTEGKRLIYGEAYDRINKVVLTLRGILDPPDTETVWPDILPEDENYVAQVLLAEWQNKLISTETYRTVRGWDDMTESERVANEGSQGDIGSGILSLLANNQGFNRGQ